MWMTRNDFIFKGSAPNLYRCRKKSRRRWLFLFIRLKTWVERFR
jgi:hypothetical protein